MTNIPHSDQPHSRTLIAPRVPIHYRIVTEEAQVSHNHISPAPPLLTPRPPRRSQNTLSLQTDQIQLRTAKSLRPDRYLTIITRRCFSRTVSRNVARVRPSGKDKRIVIGLAPQLILRACGGAAGGGHV